MFLEYFRMIRKIKIFLHIFLHSNAELSLQKHKYLKNYKQSFPPKNSKCLQFANSLVESIIR